MRELMAITKALADPNRVRMLLALRGSELCVCQITELFGLAPSTVSKHLSILHQAGLIDSRKAERWVFYRLPGPEAPAVVRRALGWVQETLAKDPQVAGDTRSLNAILKMDPKRLCQRQCRS